MTHQAYHEVGKIHEEWSQFLLEKEGFEKLTVSKVLSIPDFVKVLERDFIIGVECKTIYNPRGRQHKQTLLKASVQLNRYTYRVLHIHTLRQFLTKPLIDRVKLYSNADLVVFFILGEVEKTLFLPKK